ncbi:hypothetical protein [Sinisalibacter aestuarii]|uniref:Uncharacterized protein n=1 Tax=Sinisalibacter aestuarii TaxID=2949426 RepID=A0ABQ5LQP0_9RHOB|nr:hypothetical protein [Sinisalibacter aestuarii]GKY86586.1 hypothetical protein STA1M1_04550 [Sinisalibacter aestuarii]
MSRNNRLSGIVFLFSVLSTTPAFAETNYHIEMAARINVAENICDINFGDRLLHHVMMGGSELGLTLEQAAIRADRRHEEIVRYLNRNSKLDEFCRNARQGKL